MEKAYKIPEEMISSINDGIIYKRIRDVYKTIDFDSYHCSTLFSKEELLQFMKAYIVYAILSEYNFVNSDGNLYFVTSNEMNYSALLDDEDKVVDELSTFMLIIRNADVKKEDLQNRWFLKRLAMINFNLKKDTPEFKRLDKFDDYLKKFVNERIELYEMDIDAEELFLLTKNYLAYICGKDELNICGNHDYLNNIVYNLYQLYQDCKVPYSEIDEKYQDRKEVVQKLRSIIRVNHITKD